MKTSRDSMNRQNKQGVTSKPRPEIRDDLDSRSGKEEVNRGNKKKTQDKETEEK
jgi:hypothetical protein